MRQSVTQGGSIGEAARRLCGTRFADRWNADKATADFKVGMLTITLPKFDEAKPRSIQVRSGSGRGQTQDIEIAIR